MTTSLTPVDDPHALARGLAGRHLIDGSLVPASSAETFDVHAPATMAVIGGAAAGGAEDVDRAVTSAKRAQKAWAARSARERGKLVAACGRLLEAHVQELGRLTALETGKALRTESRVEASVLADVFVYYGGLASELQGSTVPFNPSMLTLTLREPIGVIGAIIPWNAPLLLMALKVAPALVAGHAVVLKTAEEAPFGALQVARIMQQVLPAGVLNVLSGDGPGCGGPLCQHPDVGKITFTGSVETGRIIYRAAAEKLIPVTLELGGKSPMIVMDDADLDRAVAGAVGGMRFTRQGQSCTAASRMFVHERLHDAFIDRLRTAVDAMAMGDPMDEATDIGTVISERQLATVQRYIELGRGLSGVTTIECSQLPTDAHLADGLFVRPVLFTGMSHEAPPAREEIFGPVTCIFPFSDYEQALAMANDSPYGLAATIWTKDLKIALDAIHRLEAGFVQVNQNLVVQPMLAYGGVKHSGLGKEASLEAMLNHFTHSKTVLMNMT